MPILLSPRSTFKVVLESDKESDPQPAFIFRAVSAEAWSDLAEGFDNAKVKQRRGFDVMRDLVADVGKYLVGWENMTRDGAPVPFAAAEFGRMVIVPELWQLYYALLASNRPTADEKKT